MAKYTSVLSQLLRYIPRSEFQSIVQRHGGDKGGAIFVVLETVWGSFLWAVNRTAHFERSGDGAEREHSQASACGANPGEALHACGCELKSSSRDLPRALFQFV